MQKALFIVKSENGGNINEVLFCLLNSDCKFEALILENVVLNVGVSIENEAPISILSSSMCIINF